MPTGDSALTIKEQKTKFFVNNWLFQSALTYKNWWVMFLDYLYPSFTKEYILKTWRFGNYFIRPKDGDVTVANEVFVSNEYGIKGSKQKKLAIDVGANIGTFTIGWLKNNKDGVVFAYEPDPENFRQLKRNLELNNLSSKVTCKKAALGEKEEEVDFTIGIKHACGTTKSLVQGDLVVGEKTIKASSLLLQNEIEKYGIEQIDFLKVDCEGSEYEILYGLKKSTIDRIKKVVVEAHTLKSGPKTHTPDVLYRHLVARGFKVERKVFFEFSKTHVFVCTKD